MFFVLLLAAVALSPLVLALNSAAIHDGLQKGGVFPDVLDEFEPQSELRITYHLDTMLQMGITLQPDEVHEAPHVWFSNTNNTSQFTMAFFDPDAEENAPYLYWLVTNIDGQRPATDISNDDPRFQYVPYLAPTGSDTSHRYLFVLLEQSKLNQTIVPEDPRLGRASFDLNAFAESNDMKVVSAMYVRI